MLNLRFIARQITGAKRQSAVFVLCVALSMITLVSLGSFSRSVQSSLLRDAQALHAADIIIRAHAPLPDALQAEIDSRGRQKALATTRYYEFYSVLRRPSGAGSLLSGRGPSPSWIIAGAGTLFFLTLVLVRIRELKSGLYFVLALVLLILLCYLLALATLAFLRRRTPGDLAFRQALKGLFRPRNASLSIMVTLSAALAVIFSIAIVEKNLDASFVASFPPGAPNVFLLDIQPAQKADFAATLGVKAEYYPVVRGTVNAINGRPIDPEKEREARGDNLARDFNLTYWDTLLGDERIVAGKSLFRKDWPERQVSVLDTVLKMHRMAIGDTITFRVQGIELKARVASVRERTGGGLTPYFYFVFPASVLGAAPQTIFGAARVARGEIAALQDRVVARFPNVSVVNLTETVTVFARLMGRLSVIVRFFTSFSMAAGILIVVSSVFATRQARIKEAVYYTILGARKRFVLAVFAAESLVLGLSSGVIALVISQLGSLVVCRSAFDLSYRPYLVDSLLLVAATTLLAVLVGMAASVSILRLKPVSFLRGQADE